MVQFPWPKLQAIEKIHPNLKTFWDEHGIVCYSVLALYNQIN